MPVTMKDIAERAGVSIRTVSRVVNGQGEISETTATRIQAIIDELGYRPNQMARGLVSNRTSSLGYVVADIRNPFYSEVAQGILHASRAHGYQMMLSSHENQAQEQRNVFESLVAQGVDGIIVFPARDSAADFLRFAETFRPIVAIDYDVEHPNIGVVGSDVYRGAHMAVEYLVAQGHTRIGMINAARSIKKIREGGFRDAMKKHGIPFAEDMIVPGDGPEGDIAASRWVTTNLLTRHPETTAIFCYNDLMAIGAIRASQDLGRHVPRDLAIIGFDDTFVGRILKPELTTIRIDKFEVGSRAVDILLAMLNRQTTTNQSTLLDVSLVIRDSA